MEYLDQRLAFPDTATAEADGLLAIGGDLSVERLLLAYRQGIFPWFSSDAFICWYAPPVRCVLFPGEVYTSKSMKKVFKDGSFKIKINTAFPQVIDMCGRASRKGEGGTWITPGMKTAYTRLHEAGHAHSIEVWQQNELAGGLYGLAINGVFCGESMFSLVSNASKFALLWLCREGGYRLVDCQLPNDHLLSLGARMISREEYFDILQNQSV